MPSTLFTAFYAIATSIDAPSPNGAFTLKHRYLRDNNAMDQHRLKNMKTTVAYLLLCLIALSLRLAYIIHDRTFDDPARGELERAAANLASQGSFANAYSPTSGPTAHVAPLYPLFLAGLYRVFGWNSLAGVLAEEFCSIACTTAGLALLPTVARKAHLSVAAGWLSAYVLALLPLNLWVECSGSWEQPYSAFVLLVLLICFCNLREEHWRRPRTVIGTGLVMGLAALLSPALLPAGILMALAEFAALRADRRRVAVGCLALTLIAVLLMAPWMVRNYLTFERFIPFRSNFGLELAFGNNPQSNGMTFPPPSKDPPHPLNRHPYRDAPERTHLLEVGEYAYMHEKQSAALRWVADNPGQALALTARRFMLFWFPPVDMYRSDSPARVAKVVVFDALGIGALACLVWLALSGHDRAWLLIGATIGPSLIYMVTHVTTRYRYPIFALTTLLSAHALLSVGLAITKRWGFFGRLTGS